MKRGWIRLWRKMLDNPLMRRPVYRAVWIEILLRANHAAEVGLNPVSVMFGGRLIRLKAGQFTTGAYQMSRAVGAARGTVERILRTLKNEELISVETDHQCSLITVKKWNLYQPSISQNGERAGNERGTSGERVRTKQEVKNNRTEEDLTNLKSNSHATPPASPVSPKSKTAPISPSKGIVSLIEAFAKINPSINYGQTTIRSAADWLIQKYGVEESLKLADLAVSVQGKPFSPLITDPYQLKLKLAHLSIFIQKESAPRKGAIQTL